MELHIFQPFLKRGPLGRFRNRFRGRLFPSCGNDVHRCAATELSAICSTSPSPYVKIRISFQQFVQFVIGIGKRKESRFLASFIFRISSFVEVATIFCAWIFSNWRQRLLAVTVNQPFGNYNKVYAVHLVQLLTASRITPQPPLYKNASLIVKHPSISERIPLFVSRK